MIKPEMIPDEVVEAMCNEREEWGLYSRQQSAKWIAAALNAWPNHNIVDDDVVYVDRAIMLPLPQEADDE